MKRMNISDSARFVALLASMAISYSVERDLALTHGVAPMAACAVPLAIDVYMIWAVRTSRDVVFSVLIAFMANTAGVLTAHGASFTSADLYVGAALHGIFPVTVWRMHRHHADAEDSTVEHASQTVEHEDSTAVTQVELPQVETVTLPKAPPQAPTDPRVRAALCRSRGMSARATAGEIGTSHTTVARWWRESDTASAAA